MDDITLRKVQLTELEILKVIDVFCRNNKIKYSLYGGTLLGAVRHKGFIPWDDDIDICMKRDQYNIFIETWTKHPPEGYILQNKDNSPRFPSSFTKIRKDHTTFLHDDVDRGRFHTGIFVDVFPIDRVPNNPILKYLLYWNWMRYHLYTREYVPTESNIIVKAISKFFLCIVKPTRRPEKRRKLLNQITKYNDNPKYSTVGAEVLSTMRVDLPCALMDSFITISFENEKFMCVKDWDEYLSRTYGDYMQLPPKEEQKWTHHPIIIDFEHNYEELEEDD